MTTRVPTPKVLHVIGSLNPGGVEMWLLSLFRELQSANVESLVCTLGATPGSMEPAAAELGVGVVHCPLRPLASFPGRFSTLLTDSSVRVVHSHVHNASGWLLWLASRAGVPVRIAHSHTTLDGHSATPLRRLYRSVSRRLILRHATAGLAASSTSAAGLLGEGWKADSRFRVVHNGIDLAPFSAPVSADETRRDLGLPRDAIVVGHIGRFHAVKNHRFFLHVAEALARRDSRIRFLFVGQGPLRGAIEHQAQVLGIRQLCVFVGGLGVDVPRVLLGGMDLLLFPSLWEGLPVSLIEAQAAGLPILASASITTEVAAVPSLLTFLSLDDDPERWAGEAQRALTSPRLSAQQARECLAQTDFDIRRSAGDLVTLYTEVGSVEHSSLGGRN